MVQEGFLRDLRVGLIFFLHFLDGDLTSLQFCVCIGSQLINVAFHVFDLLVDKLLVLLLEVEDLVAKNEQRLHLVRVRSGQLLNNLVFVLDLLLPLLNKAIVLGTDACDLRVFLLNEVL